MKTRHSMMKRTHLFLTLFLCCQMTFAQITSGGLSGVVRATNGETLPGATVVATHIPTGTNYATITSLTGNYNLQGMRVGGPYTLKISFMGRQTQTIENITIQLGESQNINASLGEDAVTLEGAVIVGERLSRFNQERTGATTNISNLEIIRKPSLTRNLSDIAALSPYNTGSSSFGGRESFATNFTVDGANFNNNFGLTEGGMPGVAGDPISLEAIEEMQVVVAPYDVRQSNFTGAGINAVTKSGSNIVKGSVYGS